MASMESLDVSLLTVTHNEFKTYLPRCLASIDSFLDPGSYEEHIIWDNASGKEQVDWLRRLEKRRPKTRIIYSKENLFDLPALNEAVPLTDTGYILYLNSLSRLFNAFSLAKLVALLGSFKNAIMLGHPGPWVQGNDHTEPFWGCSAELLIARGWLKETEDWNTSHVQTWAFLLKKKEFLDTGGFRVKSRLFDSRWPELQFPESWSIQGKGDLMAAEVEFGVRARRMGYYLIFCGYHLFPAYHYVSGFLEPKELEAEDAKFGFPELPTLKNYLEET